MMNKNIFTTVVVILITVLSGCEKYLNVEPKSSIAEDKMFRSEAGFQQALGGVYSQLAGQSLYGDRLSMGFVSALAQNYGVTFNNAPYVETNALNYNSSEVLGHLSTIWLSAYNAIASLNKIIANTEENRSVLSSESYGLIRGEALGLRGLLHFELLRLYGPEYVRGANVKAIPYKTTTDQYANEPWTTDQVINRVLEDLKESADLLRAHDVVDNTTILTRRIKFNYYAAKGLEARVKLYMGDKVGAFAAAKEVVDSEAFVFVTPARAGAAAGSRDRLYINELVFSLRSRNMLDWVDFYFKFNINTTAKLTRTQAQIDEIYEYSTTDLRLLYLFEEDMGAIFPSKFWQTYTVLSGASTTTPNRLDQLVPVIRLSEMYYILAETATTPSEGLEYLNTVKINRAIQVVPNPAIDWYTLEQEIKREYEKEFYAEGQLFFYYKRKNTTRMMFMTEDIPLSTYRLPIPDAELEYNPTY